MITQTGGGCRATNYISMLRKALRDAGYGHIPVISLNFAGLEGNPGFSFSYGLLRRALMSLTYGDALMRMLYRVRPYEAEPGSANELHKKWTKICQAALWEADWSEYCRLLRQMAEEFEALPLLDIKKPRVGLVGEILVKFHPVANNFAVDVIEQEGGEAVMPDLIDFFLFFANNANVRHRLLSGSFKSMFAHTAAIHVIEHFRKPLRRALKGKKFGQVANIFHMAKKTDKVVSTGNICGEGWFLTGEMLELMDEGVNNIICMQPFACLPNHVTGKGVMRELKRQNPQANIVAVDYDPGASEVNQVNRVKLMLERAFYNLDNQASPKDTFQDKANRLS
jgi:predicted nucleotide-binding protein (sugar kinase/HSP70/actin superfamily)